MSPDRLLAHFDRIADAPDAIPRLRRFILALAVQGKLVEKVPTDEPVLQLIKRIQTEKVRLMKEGQIRKRPLLPAVNSANTPFLVPKHWAWLQLEGMGVLSGGMTPSKNRSEFWGGKINWFSPKDIKSDELVDSELKITATGLAETGLQLYPPGCLFMVARSGILKRTFPVSINRVEATANQDLKVLTPFVEGLERYLQIMFRGMTDFILSALVKTGTTVQSLKYEEFESQPIPLPPLAEQYRIVAKVDELMALCDRLEAAQVERENRRDLLAAASLHRLNNGADAESLREHARFHLRHLSRLTTRRGHVQQLRHTILTLAVCGRLVPQDPNDESASELLKRIRAVKVRLVKERKISRDRPLPLIAEEDNLRQLPNGWEWVRMQDAFDVRDGTHDTPKYIEDDGVPLITSRNFVDGRISFEDAKLISWDDHNSIKKRSGVDQGDILYSMIGGNIGNQVMVETDREFSIKNVALFKYYSKSDATPAYLDLFLKTVTIGLQGQAAGGAQPFVSLKQLRSIPFPMPPFSEQHRIVAKVEELMVLCDRLEAQLTTTRSDSRRLFDAILGDALSRHAEILQEVLQT